MFENFDSSSRRVVLFARQKAGRLGGPAVGLHHLALGVLQERSDSRLSLMVTRLDTGRAEIPSSVDLPIDTDCKAVFKTLCSKEDIGVRDIVLEILKRPDSQGARILRELDIAE